MLVFVIIFRKIIMIRKVMRIGNSVGITLDKKMLQSLGLDGINEVWVEPASTELQRGEPASTQRGEPDKSKKQIVIRKRTEKDW
jgi:hypothetical protein